MARECQCPLTDKCLDILRIALERFVEDRRGLAVVGRVTGLARPLHIGRAERRIGVHVVGVQANAFLVVPYHLIGLVDHSPVGGRAQLVGRARRAGRRGIPAHEREDHRADQHR
jgi:hypothetical protein